MTEEKPSGFRAEPAGGSLHRIISIGRDPWLVKNIEGVVRFKRPDAARLKVTALDANGMPAGAAGTADALTLQPTTVYYTVEP